MTDDRPPTGAGSTPAERDMIADLVTRLRGGDAEAFDRLFPILYGRLRSQAHAQRIRMGGRGSLNTTALVHELYIKLAGHEKSDWRDRAHFLAVAATAMRQILIDQARSRMAKKRGGARRPIPFDEVRELLATHPGFTDERMTALLALDASLTRLEQANPRQHRIVECRFFGGMTIPDTAEALGVSPATVKRGWTAALAWLYRDLKEGVGPGESDWS